jgi:hypothetical protein
VLDVVGKGGGQPLAPEARADMEGRLGADFSNVRVHTDAQAAKSAAAVSAQAYTVGNEVVFGHGSFAPYSAAGKRTLAHELAHVQQQRKGPVSGTDTGGGVAISDPSDDFEQEAEATANRALSDPTRAASVPPIVSRLAIDRKYDPGLPSGHTVARLIAAGATGEIAEVPRQASLQRQADADVVDSGRLAHEAESALTSARFTNNERLQAAYHNRPPIMRGEVGDAVARIQQALLDDGIPLPISTRRTGSPDGIFGPETEEAVRTFQRVHGISVDGRVGHDTLTELDKVGPRPTPREEPIAPPLEPGEEHREWTVQQYIDMWEKKEKRKMTQEERDTLARGCIGISALNLGRGNTNPPLDLSFSTFDKAKSVAAAINQILESKPAADTLPSEINASAQLRDLKNVLSSFPVDPDPTKWKAVIFSKRFYSNQDPDWEKRKKSDPNAFLPDPKTGQVDMSGYHYEARPGFVNFDYGWYDEETDSWWHANHMEPGMEVYQSTLEYYSRPLQDFDRQVFTVALARRGK